MTPDCIVHGVASYWEGGVATGVAGISFRPFDERGAAGLSVALWRPVLWVSASAAVGAASPAPVDGVRRPEPGSLRGADPPPGRHGSAKIFVPVAALGGQIDGFCGSARSPAWGL